LAIKHLKGKLILGSLILASVIFAVYGMIWTVYLTSDVPPDTQRTGPITMLLMALFTSVVWFGLTIAVIVIAWKWFSPKPPPTRPET
jgi:hypothetical protein